MLKNQIILAINVIVSENF